MITPNDTDRINYIQSLDEPILEVARAKTCMCNSCRGYTLREYGSGKRSYSERSLRDAIDMHMRGELEEFDEF